jgi:HEAT repeat protein
MRNVLTRLFAIRPGEEKKTVLLYVLHLLFYLGLMWGEFASETLFLQAWGADSLAWMFIGNAVLAFVLALIYTIFVDWFSNARLLQIIVLVMIGWLVSVRVLLETNGGTFGAVYPYYYLAYGALRDLSTLHILNYINDFYDTRAAKSALPLMLSAGIVGSTLAGLSAPMLSQSVGLANVTLMWVVCLVLVLGVMVIIRRQLGADIARIRQARLAIRIKPSTFGNLHAGWSFVRASGVLRWLAIATFAMVVLMRLLSFQSSQVFLAHFQNDASGLFNFYGLLGGLASAVGLLIQTLVLSRLVARLGVGTTNLVFPSITLIAITTLDFFPNLFTATLGRLDLTMIKQAIRNPLDAMLFNAVPLHIKGRAKAFVNAMIVPLGTLIAGVLLLSVQLGGLPFAVIIGVGILLGVIYIAASWRVRAEYGRALAELLAGDETAILQLSPDDLAQPDPATLTHIQQRLHDSADDEMTLFLAELLYEMQGRESFATLGDLAKQRSPRVRAGIVQMLGADWITETPIRSLCLQSIVDQDALVRQAAAVALANAPDAIKNKDLLALFLGLLNDADARVEAAVIHTLIASGEPTYSAPAQNLLATWLAHDDSEQRARGLRVLAHTRDANGISTLEKFLHDESVAVRRQAVELIDQLARQTQESAIRESALHCFRTTLTDDSEDVRLVTIQGLGHLNNLQASRALIIALNDRSFAIRRAASMAMLNAIPPELDSPDAPYYQTECRAFILATKHQPRAQQRVLELVQLLVSDLYALHLRCLALDAVNTPGAHLLQTNFQEEIQAILERVFWLLGAFGGETQIQAIQRALPSDDPLTHANAVEALETISSPQVARLCAPLFEHTSSDKLEQIARESLNMSAPTASQVFAQTWSQFDEYLTTTVSPNLAEFNRNDLLAATTIYAQIENLDAPADRKALCIALQATLSDERPLVREIAQWGLARVDTPTSLEAAMLNVIGKVIFLKQVPFFQGMTLEQLRILASISEQVEFEPGQKIYTQDEPGDALYVIVNGHVTIQKQGRRRGMVTRLATLGPKDFFGETSFLDSEPHSADAVAMESASLLIVRQAPFLALIRQYPDLAIGLIQVFSQRLRQANDTLAEKTQAKPKELIDLYDKL